MCRVKQINTRSARLPLFAIILVLILLNVWRFQTRVNQINKPVQWTPVRNEINDIDEHFYSLTTIFEGNLEVVAERQWDFFCHPQSVPYYPIEVMKGLRFDLNSLFGGFMNETALQGLLSFELLNDTLVRTDFENFLIESKIKLTANQLTHQSNHKVRSRPQVKITDKKSLSKPKSILILSMSNFDISGSTDRRATCWRDALQTRETYANKWGYQHEFINVNRYTAATAIVLHPVWYKIPAIQETFARHPEVDWIWCLDIDAMIMNYDFNLAKNLLSGDAIKYWAELERPVAYLTDRFYPNGTYSPEKIDDYNDISFIFSHDALTINAGSFFVHRTNMSNEILETWGDPLNIFRYKKNVNAHARLEQDAFIDMYIDLPFVREATVLVPQALINSYPKPDISALHSGDFVAHFAGQSKSQDFIRRWNFVKEIFQKLKQNSIF